MKVKAIKVNQPLGEFYVAKIKAGDLLEVTTSSVLRYDINGKLIGNQRPLVESRLKEISNFIKSDEMSFPTSILIAANIDEYGLIEDENRRWSLLQKDDDLFEINIPKKSLPSALIIDGQHRLNAFKYANEYTDIELVCSIFFDLPNPYQAYLFATINGNQKKVDKSLALELFGFNVEYEPSDTWSPEKLAVYLTRKLNFTKESPLYQKIKLAPLYTEIEQKVDKGKWLLSTAAMVEGIMSLITSQPQRDRDFLAIKKKSIFSDKTRKSLNKFKDKSVLRSVYLESKDEEIYRILFEYFQTVDKVLWTNAPSNSVIIKTIGISALFDVLKTLLCNNFTTKEYFIEMMEKIKDIDFTNNYFQLSGKGKTRLKRILKYKMGLSDSNSLKDEDFEFLDLKGI